VRDIGLGLAFGILMDTFLVRTLLVPSTVVMLGRWNWWPSRLGRPDRHPADHHDTDHHDTDHRDTDHRDTDHRDTVPEIVDGQDRRA
jgi:uncharacterized membrane protein YdfJ with MMPL/SSD domain